MDAEFFCSRYSLSSCSVLFSAHSRRRDRSSSYFMTGTEYPHESEILSAVATMIERAPGISSNTPWNCGSSGDTTFPRACIRTILGGPSKEHHMKVMRPFSCKCAMVSAPLPVRSKYATVCESSTRKVSYPFGEILTDPDSDKGEVPTKKIFCRPIHSASSVEISS